MRPGRSSGHHGERAFHYKALAWSTAAGAMAWLAVALRGGSGELALGLALGALVAAYAGSMFVVAMTGRAAGAVLLPSGRSTPPPPPLSGVEALVLQGRHADAAAALERLIPDHPQEADLYVRLARLHAGPLGSPAAARRWYDHALAAGTMTPALAAQVRRERDDLLTAHPRRHS